MRSCVRNFLFSMLRTHQEVLENNKYIMEMQVKNVYRITKYKISIMFAHINQKNELLNKLSVNAKDTELNEDNKEVIGKFMR
jgi:hypothetical protein